MNSKSWLVRRALLAIALMVGFYVLALSIVAGLLWIPYAEWTYVGRIHLKIAALCIGGAFTVLWAILPRIDRFEPPGPRLDENSCPDLFRLIREVAAATGQSEPADVYLVNEVNAWVTQRGGVMGFGSRRVMGIGLPLLQTLSELELKAIIAHEFGHYSSGDVSLGPWIYKTRAAIGRAIEGVHESLLEAPFQWYGKLFLRLTHAVSRQQEFIADRISAKVAGAAAAASALRQVTALAPAFHAYIGQELAPVLNAGFLPPIAGGFTEFLKAERITGFTRLIVEHAEQEDTTDEFDTHPSLKQRLAALGTSGSSPVPANDARAASRLIPEIEKHALSVARFAYGAHNIDGLKPLDWTAVGENVHIPQWRSLARNSSRFLGRFTPDTLPTTKDDLIRAGSDLVAPGEENINADDRIGRAVHVLGVGLGLALLDQGFQINTGVGKPIVLVRGTEAIDPFKIVNGLGFGEIDPAEWKARCSAAGISGRLLGVAQGAPA